MQIKGACMNDIEFLERIFRGYVMTYRANLWHTTANYSDMTSAELGFFTRLGSHLGYVVRREMNWDYPRDLCWCESTEDSRDDEKARTILYLERENSDGRVDKNTVEKLLKTSNGVKYLVAVLGWVRRATLEAAKEKVRKGLGEQQYFFSISWVGETPDGEFEVEAWICHKETERVLTAKASMDEAGYWYLHNCQRINQ